MSDWVAALPIDSVGGTCAILARNRLSSSPKPPTISTHEFCCMIDLHYWTTPNGHKISIFLEEAGVPYKIIPVNINKGEQFRKEFLAVSPNNRIPAIVDHDPAGGGAP